MYVAKALKVLHGQILKDLNIKSYEYFLVSIHREENVDQYENLVEIVNTLNIILDTYKMPVIVSTHPRTKKMLEKMRLNMSIKKGIYFMKPFGFLDYIKLQENSYCVLSDSGSITEESIGGVNTNLLPMGAKVLSIDPENMKLIINFENENFIFEM